MKTMTKRIISLVLCLAMVMSYIPMTARAELENASNQTVDPSTMDSWREHFLKSTLSTENAGKVWTDKSVFKDAAAFAGTGITMAGKDSFLVALSTIGSNMSVTGVSSVPSDTMLVLDISISMNSSNNDVAEELVEAANASIKTLLESNPNNRVGVVLYGTNASLILPLGRYTTGSDGKYLNYGRGYGWSSESVSLDTDVRYEGQSEKPPALTQSFNGSTYIQKGLNLAMDQFVDPNNETTILDPQMGTITRKPILVLMSDGAPTYASSNFTEPDSSDLGTGMPASTSAALSFVTQLTAAYIKAQIEAKYGTSSLFYTLGLGTDNSDEATGVMDPGKSNTAINKFWEDYNNAAVGGTVTVRGSGNNATKVTKISQPLNKNYVTKAFSVSAGSNLAAGLIQAFQDIVNAIQLQSQYYPTLVGANEELSGYVSFVDHIGEYMEVIDIKGVLIHNTLFSGATLAKNFAEGVNGGDLGSRENPKELGNELVHSVQARLGIADVQIARDLISLAYQHGQLRYNSASDYSNYIGWYANKAGQFLGFYNEGTTVLPEGTGNEATDPYYTFKSYLHLGEVDEEHGVTKSDLMYATIRVRTTIETGEQTVAFAVPAALVPLVTYKVSLDKSGNLTGLQATGAQHPIRLVYEVALDSEINPFTVKELVSADYISANTDASGNISFFSNQYEKDNSVGYGKNNTYSYFHPSRQNDRYYFLTNTTVYSDQNGTVYRSSSAPTGAKYRAYTVYVKQGSTLKTETHYRRIADRSLQNAVNKGDNTWYIPAGNVHVNLEGYADAKVNNATGTLANAYEPYVDVAGHNVGDTGYNFIVGATLGNNGKLSVTPATGIALTKLMAPGATAPSTAFSFRITNTTNGSDNGTYPVRVLHADSTTSVTSVKFEGGKATVALNAGETLYIGGMTAGTVYTVEEVPTAEYIPDQPSATVTIAAGELKAVQFINADRGTGNLTIAKDVEHNLGADYVIPAGLKFTIRVRLSGIGTANKTFSVRHSGGTIQSVTTDATGAFVLTLAHHESVTVLGLPAGTQASVVEETPGAGFTPGYMEDGVAGDGNVVIRDKATVTVTVENKYTPNKVTPVNIELKGTKIYNAPNWNGAVFTFELQRWNGAGWTTIATDTASAGKQTFDFSAAMQAESFTAPGAYYYQVLERNGGQKINGITYDATLHTFSVVVTDKEMDGRLEIDRVVSTHTGNSFNLNASGNFEINVSFTNRYNATGCDLVLDVQKQLQNLSGSPLVDLSGYVFGLYNGNTLVAQSEPTDGVGEGRIVVHYELANVGIHTYTLKEIAPASPMPGMTYSTATYEVKVQVLDDGDGTTSASVISINGATDFRTPVFTNVYDPTDAELVIDFVRKLLSGRALRAGEFNFAVLDANGTTVATGTNGADGKVTFNNKLSFNKVGTYAYTVIETSADGKGVTTDKTHHLFHVIVSDVGGELQANYTVISDTNNIIEFQNIYAAKSVSHTIRGHKTLLGRTLLNDEFTFILSEADASGNIIAGGMSREVKNFADGSFVFPEIEFTKAGAYYYVVSEKEGNSVYGIIYDKTAYLVSVTVTDDGEGQLKASSSIRVLGGNASTAITFTNKYEPDPVSTQIPGNKTLTGMVLGAGKFSFELYQSNASWAQGAKLQTVTNGADGSILFTALPEFTEVGTWYYLVKEVNGGQTIDGITYDDSVFRVAVVVTDNLMGKLVATIYVYDEHSVPQSQIAFVNSYTVTGTDSVTVSGTKELQNATLKNGQFTFDLYETGSDFHASGAALQSAANNAGKFIFSMHYGPADIGTHYSVASQRFAGQTIDGITYSSQKYYITVVVADDGKGGITATATISDGVNHVASMDFVNVYGITGSTQLTIGGHKVLEGGVIRDGDYTFQLFASDASFAVSGGAIATATNMDGFYSFALTYNPADIGKHYYVVTEKDGGKIIDGISYSTAKYFVTVTVADDGKGGITATATYSDGSKTVSSMDFVNVSYGLGSLTITKEVFHALGTDYVLPSGLEFAIRVQLSGPGTANQTFLAEHSDGEITSVTTDANGVFTVMLAHDEQITIHGLLGGTVVAVTEPNPGKGFTVEYREDDVISDGVLTVVRDATVSVAVENTYAPEQVGNVNVDISGTKVYKAPNWNGSVFTFELQRWNGVKWVTIATDTATSAKQTFNFAGALAAETFATPGAYYYQVVEKNGGQVLNGITYDATLHTFGITVTDKDMDGVLEIDKVVSYHTGKEFEKNAAGNFEIVITFTNEYNASGCNVVLDVKKQLQNLSGSPLVTPAGFQVGLYQGNTLIAKSELTDGVGEARIILHYEHADVGIHTYTLKEIVPTSPISGMTYSTATYEVKVEVRDDGDGTTSAKIISINGKTDFETPVFTNIYAPGKASLEVNFVSKALTGRNQVAGEFTFAVLDQNGKTVLTGTNGADGKVTFNDKLYFDKGGEYSYTVIETSADGKGVTVDKTRYVVHVRVTDSDGKLNVSYSVLNVVGNQIVFHNTYRAKGTSVTLGGTKILTGKTLEAGAYSFLLIACDASGNPIPGGLQMEVKNNADGSFTFPAMTYTNAGINYYLVKELHGGETIHGVLHDNTVYRVTVTVTDDLVGQLHAKAAIAGADALVFKNTYVPGGSANVTLNGTKVLQGVTLHDGQFTFELYKADGNFAIAGAAIQTATNKAGKFGFQLNYTASDIGTHYYVVREMNGGKEIDGIAYSNKTYYITVVVADDGLGGITATATISDGSKNVASLEFLNSYGVSGSETVSLGGNKTLQGATLTDGQFTFELHKTDSTFHVVGAAVQTATNKAGKFGFDLHFNATDIGTHYFVVLEKNAGKTVNGITYSAAQYYITVVVADNGKGGITVTTSITDGVQVVKEMNFVNTYAVTGTYDIMLEAHKTLEGKTLAAGEFSFALYHANKNFVIYAGALQNVANGADGSVRFSGLTIREAGKYYFVVAENKADAIENVTYDESVYHITVEIVDDGKGGLKLKDMKIVKILGENSETVNAITFVNTYTPDPDALPLDFEVNKTVTNLGTEVIGPEGFIFQLENMTVGGILTAVSDENGKAVFTLTFTEDDIGKVYTYKLTEVNDGREHVTYSDVAYNITVAISLNENNELVATITNNGAEVQKIVADFENIYDYTPEPDKTGDPGLMLWSAMLAVSGLGGMVTMKTFGKKKDGE